MRTAATHRPPARPATVLVLWVGHRPGPWVRRSLAAAGHRVLPAHPEGAPGGRPVGAREPLRYPSPTRSPDAFVRWVRETCRISGVDVVLSLDEDITRLLAPHAPRLGGARVAGPDARQYRMLCDKGALAATAAAAGVGRPAAVAVGADGPRGDWPPLPCVVKPHRSTADTGDLPAVRVVHDAAARDRAVADLVDAGLGAVVEERVAGEQWVAHCVRAADGGFAGVAARVRETAPRDAGTPSVLDVVGDHPPVLDAVRRLFAHAGYVGLGNAQFLVRGGEVLVHDVNLRPPASIGLAVRAGFDAPAWGVAAVLGDARGMSAPPVRPFRYVSADGEAQVVAAHLRTDGGRGAAPVAARVLAAGLPGGGMMDPPLTDLAWLGDHVGRVARRAAGRAV